ncbi:MAG: hypothetical protein LBQ23_03120 [Puniceicoccales bacterium]|jgi:hypothetical protein|nr:hypothetical protein [Puniceicoccales bacterium]
MNDKVFLTINKTIESEILEKALNCKSGCAVTVADSNGQQISIVGPKKGGVEGGAIISLQNRSVSVSSEESTDHPPVRSKEQIQAAGIQGIHRQRKSKRSCFCR